MFNVNCDFTVLTLIKRFNDCKILRTKPVYFLQVFKLHFNAMKKTLKTLIKPVYKLVT